MSGFLGTNREIRELTEKTGPGLPICCFQATVGRPQRTKNRSGAAARTTKNGLSAAYTKKLSVVHHSGVQYSRLSASVKGALQGAARQIKNRFGSVRRRNFELWASLPQVPKGTLPKCSCRIHSETVFNSFASETIYPSTRPVCPERNRMDYFRSV